MVLIPFFSLPQAKIMIFNSFLALFCAIYLCSTVSVARHDPANDEDPSKPNHGHTHKLHHVDPSKGGLNHSRGRSGNAAETKSDVDSNIIVERDCSSEHHATFRMPSSLDEDDAQDADAGNKNSYQNEKGEENVVEIRINKYYGVHRDRFYIRNTGNSLEFKLQLNDTLADARIRGPDWDDEYAFYKGIFHWTLKNLTIKSPDGTTVFNTESKDPPLEMELIHYAKHHGSVEAAALKPKGVLVTGHLFELVGRDNPALEPISRSVLSATFPNDNFKQVHGPLDIKSLFPNELSYLEFGGMYPLNPCATEARYIVFKKTLFVSARQLKRFGGLRTESGKKISDQPSPVGGVERVGFEVVRTPSGRAGSAQAVYLSLVNSLSLPNNGDSLTNPGLSNAIKQFYTTIIFLAVAVKFISVFFKFHIFFVI